MRSLRPAVSTQVTRSYENILKKNSSESSDDNKKECTQTGSFPAAGKNESESTPVPFPLFLAFCTILSESGTDQKPEKRKTTGEKEINPRSDL